MATGDGRGALVFVTIGGLIGGVGVALDLKNTTEMTFAP